MIFKFLEKKIVLDCFTHEELILQTAPITMAIKHIPDWWKELPNEFINDPDNIAIFPFPTMKKCMGMIDYYKKSIAIPLWSELVIGVNNRSYGWQFSDFKSEIYVHRINKEATNFLTDHGHIKLISPWLFKTKQEVKWVWSQPTYSFKENISELKILPGVVDYYNQIGTNINIMLPLSTNKQYRLPQGQVLIHVTPMFDNKVEIVRHLISITEFERMRNSVAKAISFTDNYRQKYLATQKFKNCPYHKK